MKPEASCQGKGIQLIRRPCDIPVNEPMVAQRYVAKPYLIDGLKFDLRIYVLVAGVDPLRIYMFKEGNLDNIYWSNLNQILILGMVRFATETYESPNYSNLENVC